jgi:hygromycin-B 7''-O-kinase
MAYTARNTFGGMAGMLAPDLTTMDQYRRLFMDASYWAPFVKAICTRHGLLPARAISAGDVPGTYPVFIVDDKWVVKFFGDHFGGQRAFAVELEVNRLLSALFDVPRPALIAYGSLLESGDGCRWPYLVFEFVQARSLSQVRDQLSLKDEAAIAYAIGTIVRRLHSADLREAVTLRPTWDFYHTMLQTQSVDCMARHRRWRSLPERLIGQIDSFLPPAEELIERHNRPVLLHGDLTADHILVFHGDTEWGVKGVIDYGDALVGDPTYELIALHLDMFRRDKRLLREYSSAYGWQSRIGREAARKLLSLCLLFPFNAFHCFLRWDPRASTVSNLDELADWLWNTEI